MCQQKNKHLKRRSISNQQQGARQVRCNTNILVSYVPTRPLLYLAGKRPQQRSQEPQQQQSTPSTHHLHFSKESSRGKKYTKQYDTGTHACHHCIPPWILSTYYHLCGAQLNNRRRTCIMQTSRPRGWSHSQCCCVFFSGAAIVITTTSSSFNHACDFHVHIHVCMYAYLLKL